MGSHSLLYYLLLAILYSGVLQGILIGVAFMLLKKSGPKRANICFGLLLIAFGLTLLHNIFETKQVYFLPLYFTLTLPTLLFYYVKLNLYPNYRFQWTDIKHFILPIGQFIFFTVLFFSAVQSQHKPERHFYNPFYGGLEQATYLSLFFAYLYFSYRYILRKRSTIKAKEELKRILYLEKLIQILFILFCIHAGFVLSDFFLFEFFHINLRLNKFYVGLGALSFAALVFWLGIYGLQVLFWARKI